MTKFVVPRPESISGPSSMRGTTAIAVEDTSGLTNGVQNLASGVRSAANSMFAIGQEERQQQNLVDKARAEARWTKGVIELTNEFGARNDFGNFDKEVREKTDALRNEVAGMIRDEDERSLFAIQLEPKADGFVDNIGDYGRGLSQEADRASLAESLATSFDMLADPSLDEPSRNKLFGDIQQSIQQAEDLRLIDPGKAGELRRTYIDGGREALATNRFKLDLMVDPLKAQRGLGISTAMGGTDLAASALAASGGTIDIPVDIAADVAAAIGDTALPSDPALAAAYLKDPEVNKRYASVVMTELTDRYKGDMTAAVIAAAPDGGLALADKWVKSDHDESVLPASVRTHYRKVMDGIVTESDRPRLSIVAADDVDLANVEVAVLDRFEQLQTAFGEQLPIISGFRDAERNKAAGGASKSQHIDRRALDIDVSKLPTEERVRFLEMASAMGFTGIGVYKNSIHLDTGARRAWGPTHHDDSVPAWAADVIGRHNKAAITTIAPTAQGLDPRYAGLSFDQRLKLYDAARVAADQQKMDQRAGISIAAENAPAAIASSGSYTGVMPTVDDFVDAYGAAEGIDKFKTFDAQVDVAQTTYGMRTMSADQIADVVEAAMPTSTGDMAAIEAQKFDALSTAAAATLKARNDDPVGYTRQSFPNVDAAWSAIGEEGVDQEAAMSNAIKVTAEAQERLGIETPKLLPKALAENAAKAFNDGTLPQEQRMASVVAVLGASQNDDHQAAIFKQLVDAGVPAYMQGAFVALERGDQGAASYLFRAAMVDPADMKSKLPGGVTDGQIETAIGELVFDENEIGDVIHNISNGESESIYNAGLDGTLILKAAKLRLVDGSASSADEAVRKVMRDMYGDVRVVTGKSWGGAAGVKIVLPKDEPAEPLYQGFNALLPQVADAVAADLTAGANPDMDKTAASIFVQGRTNRVSTVLDEGYFTGDERNGFRFIDPKTGQAIPDENGEDLVFTYQAVLQAGASRAAAQRQADTEDPYRRMAIEGMFPEPTP
jgi:hypothetical protein